MNKTLALVAALLISAPAFANEHAAEATATVAPAKTEVKTETTATKTVAKDGVTATTTTDATKATTTMEKK